MKTVLNRKRRSRGQGTVEFLLLLPIILMLLFSVIEYAYYFGGVHYTNYAAFSAARANIANEGTSGVEDELLTGNVTSGVQLELNSNRTGIRATMPWTAQTPGFKQIMGDMGVTMEVVLGPAECEYEGQPIGEDTPDLYSDNKLKGGS